MKELKKKKKLLLIWTDFIREHSL